MLRQALKKILAILAGRTIRRYKPIIIGITGSVGKSSTKEAVFAAISSKYRTRRNEENFNNEIGVPNAVLGVNFSGSPTEKILNLLRSFWLAFGPKQDNYPKVLVLELAADRPGDIGYLVKIVKPRIGIITPIGDMPVHVQFYKGTEEVAAEKAKLLECLPKNGLGVIFSDDPVSLALRSKCSAPSLTYGFDKKADFRISDVNYFLSDLEDEQTVFNQNTIGGLSFKVNAKASFVPVKLPGVIAPHLVNAAAAAAAVCDYLGINLVDFSQAVEKVRFPQHRMQLFNGVKKSYVIDDTYNASPIAVQAAANALDAFSQAVKKIFRPGRKIAVLGDMKELGDFQISAHQEIGNLVGEKVDILITVGEAAKFIADAAGNHMKKENIFSFSSSEEAKGKVKEIIEEGDVILVKGSHSMQMDKIVEEIRH